MPTTRLPITQNKGRKLEIAVPRAKPTRPATERLGPRQRITQSRCVGNAWCELHLRILNAEAARQIQFWPLKLKSGYKIS